MFKIPTSPFILAVSLLASLGFQSLFAANAEKPNILLILVDDLKPSLGSFGDPVAVSPNIDKLAGQGMRFEMAYCNQSVCMASRYNLLLGSRSSSTGFYSFGTQFREVYPDAITLPQHFVNNGYVSHSIGKVFHIGHGNTNDDASWSVPHHADKVIEYLLPESNFRELSREEGLFTNQGARDKDGSLRPRGAAWESPDVLDDAYADGRVAQTAIDRLRWLKDNEEKPFFLAVGFVRPHLPFSAPQKYWDMYERHKLPMPEFVEAPKDAPAYAVKRRGEIMAFKPIPTTEPFPDDLTRQLIHGYYASVSYMDAQVGRLLEGLKDHGFADNTIIVLWGDHGWHLGDHGSWTKHSNYEQSNRIPIIISAPGVTKPGSVTQQLTETVDIYPTLASLAGLPAPETSQPIDGLDLTPVLTNGKKRIRDYAYHTFPKQGKTGRSIRDKRYRLVEWANYDGTNAEYELYDYEKDPLETVNVASSDKKALHHMLALLAQEPAPVPQVKRR